MWAIGIAGNTTALHAVVAGSSPVLSTKSLSVVITDPIVCGLVRGRTQLAVTSEKTAISCGKHRQTYLQI